ncbi:MAG: MbtH family NRPS accessory protein [Gemmatimonadota bacterium]|nr:MAG: MbtH family NRPS accessory protein [Gemmatimonadota bacterium]
MSGEEKEDTTIYEVVVNHEEQYSIWPQYKGDPPKGWKKVGKNGLKEDCLAYVKEVWTDMRPLSLRKQMEEAARKPGDRKTSKKEEPGGETLVQRLSKGDHPVEASLRPEKTVHAFKESIDRGYVHIKFTGTRGGTELGFRLDAEATDLGQADFDTHTGSVHLVGSLTLDYVKVRCVADVDLSTLAGKGHLEIEES